MINPTFERNAMTPSQKQALTRLSAHEGWVHPKRITEYRGVNVKTLRALIKDGLAEEKQIESYPGFAVRISDAGRAELST